jgi:hypothetical protein
MVNSLFLALARAEFEKRERRRDTITMSYTCSPTEIAGLFLVRMRIDSIGHLHSNTGDAAVAEFQP